MLRYRGARRLADEENYEEHYKTDLPVLPGLSPEVALSRVESLVLRGLHARHMGLRPAAVL